MSMKREIIWRIGLVYILVVAFAGVIVFKSLYTQIGEGDKWRRQPTSVRKKDARVMANRGDICTEDGKKLAASVPKYELRFDAVVPKDELFNEKVDSLALCLSSFFKDATKNAYLTKLKTARKQGNRYLLLNRQKVDFSQLRQIKQFPIFREGRNKGGLIDDIVNSERIKPYGELASRTIGTLNKENSEDWEGNVGLEQAFEKELKGVPGKSLQQMMSGAWVPVIVEEPQDGDDIITTLNIEYQDIVHEALLNQMKKVNAAKGTAILMEVKTGDIKAIANLSRVAPGVYQEKINHAIYDAGEPGSVIKAASMMALFEDGYLQQPEDTVDLGGEGFYKYYNRTLPETGNKKLGRITAQEMFEQSANGITKVVFDNYKNNPEKFVNRFMAMGLDKKTGICIEGETQPLVKHPDDKSWSGTTLPWMSFGYEIIISPLQILAFYNAIANEGQRMKPRLVKEVRQHGKVIKEFSPENVGGRICSKSTIKKMKTLLEGVVLNGTGKNIQTDQYSIAGKTGTARVATGSAGYSNVKYRASFVGYFPADKPMYSCIVVIDEPTNGYYAAQVSNPVFKEISDKVYSIAYRKFGEVTETEEKTLPVSKDGSKEDFLRIFNELKLKPEGTSHIKDTDWIFTHSAESENIVLKPRDVDSNGVPDVKGMGLKDALYILENAGLKVGVSGAGMVYKQSLAPGTRFREGNYIQIELR